MNNNCPPQKYMNNKTPAQAFTPPADGKKMGTIWIRRLRLRQGQMQEFLLLKVGGGGGGGGLDLRIWDLNGAHETERSVFPIPQVFSMCRRKL